MYEQQSGVLKLDDIFPYETEHTPDYKRIR